MIERDENYVLYERSDYPALSLKVRARTADYLEVLDETPLLTVVWMLIMQCMYVHLFSMYAVTDSVFSGWWLYLSYVA